LASSKRESEKLAIELATLRFEGIPPALG